MLIVAIAVSGLSIQNRLYTEEERLVFDAFKDRSAYRCGKMFRFLHPKGLSCELTTGDMSDAHRLMLIGNSHADSIKTSFSHVAERMNTSLYLLVPNDPLMKGGRLSIDSIVGEASRKKVNTIIVHHSHRAASAENIRRLAELADLRGMRVSLIMPVPTWNVHVPKALWESRVSSAALSVQTREAYRKKTSAFRTEVFALQAQLENLAVYEVDRYFCQEICAMVDARGKPLYFDAGHLTLTGSQWLFGLFERIINDSKK